MEKKKNIIVIMIFMSLCFIFTVGCKSVPQNIVPITNFDAQKYLGKWYEIARFDFLFERNMSNVTAEYVENDDGSILVINRGYNLNQHEWKKSEGKAKFREGVDIGALKVSFFGPFYSDYTVLAIDDSYSYALVGGKNYDYLWILSRTPDMPYSIQQQYVDMAESIGFDTENLVWTIHNERAL